MAEHIQAFDYEGNIVEFSLAEKNLMVNATEMAKIFGKKVAHFMGNDSTNVFIEACLNNRNSEYLNVSVKADLFTSKQKEGTWMHQILALEFAAWLNPSFKVWIYITIHRLLKEKITSRINVLKEKTLAEIEKDELEAELKTIIECNPIYIKLQKLKTTTTEAAKRLRKLDREVIDTQLSLWQTEKKETESVSSTGN